MTLPKPLAAAAAAVLSLGLWSASPAADDRMLTIGTGSVTGVYFPAGGAICRFVNQGRKEHGFRCIPSSTEGSVYNINAIRAGELVLGVVQSDVQYNAYRGKEQFAEAGAFEDLRAVFSLHAEPLYIVARANAGIDTFEDLKGKRVNVGNPGSGQRATMEVLLDAQGWTLDDFAVAAEYTAVEQSAALCDSQIDAFAYVAGIPNGSIEEAATSCDVVLVDVAGDAVDKLVKANPYYRKAVIPGGLYAGSPDDTATFGVGATLVTSVATSEEAVYTLTKAVFDHLDTFRTLHKAFEILKAEEMISSGLSAPLHDGALTVYREKGWLK